LPGSAGYAAGSVTTTFGGTSAAAPQVTGTVALMLEANPNLGWRDVRTILAMSAEQPTAIATVTNGASNWNGGGMRFSNDTG
ncbi:S8 family serine peptidase, partial [Escherichia coli]